MHVAVGVLTIGRLRAESTCPDSWNSAARDERRDERLRCVSRAEAVSDGQMMTPFPQHVRRIQWLTMKTMVERDVGRSWLNDVCVAATLKPTTTTF